ncbi:MAG TPA: histidine phosphatase family protein [Mycobacteriales bacterium]|jgi:phosphohistidine phosphatase|nr:histidine phosphatase family protein [Mycobacteriales bacterium]
MAHTLLVIRHAKAVGEASSDAERPLSSRGVRDAQVAGEWLADHDLVPDLVLVSPALRARQTWEAIRSRLGAEPATSIDARIYENTVESLLDVLNDVGDDQQCVAVVGHNPSMHALAATLADGSDADNEETARLGESFPTAAIAVFDTDLDWSQFPPDGVAPRLFVVPRS